MAAARLSNIGIGHGAIDGGGGYTYFNPQTGHEFSAVLGFTYLNFKGYKEFAAENRPDGWNAWATLVISPAAPTPSASPRRMIMK